MPTRTSSRRPSTPQLARRPARASAVVLASPPAACFEPHQVSSPRWRPESLLTCASATPHVLSSVPTGPRLSRSEAVSDPGDAAFCVSVAAKCHKVPMWSKAVGAGEGSDLGVRVVVGARESTSGCLRIGLESVGAQVSDVRLESCGGRRVVPGTDASSAGRRCEDLRRAGPAPGRPSTRGLVDQRGGWNPRVR